MNSTQPNPADAMTFNERLEQYRLVLKQLDRCSHSLNGFGWSSDAELKRTERFIDDERIRVDRALAALRNGANGKAPAQTGIPVLDAAAKVSTAAAGAGQ